MQTGALVFCPKNAALFGCKLCTKCGGVKALSEYHKRTVNGRRYYRSACRECRQREVKSSPSQAPEALLDAQKRRYAADPQFRIKHRLRNLVRHAINGRGVDGRIIDYLGVSRDEFVAWLESAFSDGMTLANYGRRWQIDHVVPCTAFDLTDEAQAKACFCYVNMRPLTAARNGRKHTGYDPADWPLVRRLCAERPAATGPVTEWLAKQGYEFNDTELIGEAS